jgi:ferredoxin
MLSKNSKRCNKMPKFNIKVDKNACIGCGNCASICPDNFKIVEGKAVPLNLTLDIIGCSQEAADACPVQAIKITKTE